MEFASDNSSGAAPEILAAITAANAGYAPSYGADQLMERVRAAVRETFEAPEAAVYLVTTGTAANALSLALLCKPWGMAYAHASAHVETDECGAPEFFIGGGRVVPVAGDNGRMTPTTLGARIAATPEGDVHRMQRGMLTLTNLTEAGTFYRPADVRALTALSSGAGIGAHMDGARFANAIAGSGATPAEMTWRAGIDILSFGGTKNGCMGVEAVVIFDPERAWEFELRRKRGGHLMSKHRFLSAQMAAYLENGLWLSLAGHANRMAARLAEGLKAVAGCDLLHPVDGNIVFARFPRGLHRKAMAAGAHYYLWPFEQSLEGPEDEGLSARLVASWSTGEADVDRFLAILRAG